jgi:hypothetical protein
MTGHLDPNTGPDLRTRGKPPPRKGVASAVDGTAKDHQTSRLDTDRDTVTVGVSGRHDSRRLHPRRLGHAADSCTTCAVAAAMTKHWRERELAALRGRARIIDLRDEP